MGQTIEPDSSTPGGEAGEELARRERALRSREQALGERAPEDAAAVSLVERERALDERECAITAAEAGPAPLLDAGGDAEAESTPAAPPSSALPSLQALARLVVEAAPDHPDRAEEWQTYLFFLRDHADFDGRLPSSFDALVHEVFEPVLEPHGDAVGT